MNEKEIKYFSELQKRLINNFIEKDVKITLQEFSKKGQDIEKVAI